MVCCSPWTWHVCRAACTLIQSRQLSKELCFYYSQQNERSALIFTKTVTNKCIRVLNGYKSILTNNELIACYVHVTIRFWYILKFNLLSIFFLDVQTFAFLWYCRFTRFPKLLHIINFIFIHSNYYSLYFSLLSGCHWPWSPVTELALNVSNFCRWPCTFAGKVDYQSSVIMKVWMRFHAPPVMGWGKCCTTWTPYWSGHSP